MKISNSTLTFLLFEATSISATTLKGTMKQNAKKWFNLWWSQGIKMWKELKYNINQESFAEEAETFYDDTAAFLYDSARILVDIDISKREEVLNYLKKLNDES
jgi:hypothetical protein